MLTLRDIMVTDVVAVDPDTTLSEAIALLIERRITGLPVVSRGRVAGVVSTSDILDSLTTREAADDVVEAASWSDPGDGESWVDEDEQEVDPFFTELGPVRLIDELERFEELEVAPDVLTERTVEEIMTRALHALDPGTSVRDAARYMVRVGIHRVLVVEEGKLVGVVTTSDFMRAVADDQLASPATLAGPAPRRRVRARRTV